MTITCELSDKLLPIGTKVYIPRPVIKGVQEDEVRGYYCTLINNDVGKPVLVPTDYKLGTANLGRDALSDAWKRSEFFLSYEDAKSHAKEYTVVATDDEWLAAIGLTKLTQRSDYDDTCELQSCCAVISDIRSLLHEACIAGYMTSMDRRNLIYLFEHHESVTSKPNLDKILAQLNLIWDDKQEPIVKFIQNENVSKDDQNEQPGSSTKDTLPGQPT